MITNEQMNSGNVDLSRLIELLVQALQSSKPASPQQLQGAPKPEQTGQPTQNPKPTPAGPVSPPTPTPTPTPINGPPTNPQQQPDKLEELKKLVLDLQNRLGNRNGGPIVPPTENKPTPTPPNNGTPIMPNPPLGNPAPSPGPWNGAPPLTNPNPGPIMPNPPLGNPVPDQPPNNMAFPCQYGDASFATAAELGQHMMTVHNQGNTLGTPAVSPVPYNPTVAPVLSNLVNTQSLRDRVLANIAAIRARRNLL